MKYRHLPRLTSRMLIELLKEHTEPEFSPGRVAMANIGVQLRAEHAARVWQAMQAVLAVAGAWDLQADCTLRGKAGVMIRGLKRAGWYK